MRCGAIQCNAEKHPAERETSSFQTSALCTHRMSVEVEKGSLASLHTAHCTLHTAHCTVHNEYCKRQIAHSTQDTEHPLHKVQVSINTSYRVVCPASHLDQPNCTALHCTVQRYTALHCTALYCHAYALYCTVLQCILSVSYNCQSSPTMRSQQPPGGRSILGGRGGGVSWLGGEGKYWPGHFHACELAWPGCRDQV